MASQEYNRSKVQKINMTIQYIVINSKKNISMYMFTKTFQYMNNVRLMWHLFLSDDTKESME